MAHHAFGLTTCPRTQFDMGEMPSIGFVTVTSVGRGRGEGSVWTSCCCDSIVPLRRRLGSKDPQGRSGDEVALKVECVMDGGVHIEKALGRARRLEPRSERKSRDSRSRGRRMPRSKMMHDTSSHNVRNLESRVTEAGEAVGERVRNATAVAAAATGQAERIVQDATAGYGSRGRTGKKSARRCGRCGAASLVASRRSDGGRRRCGSSRDPIGFATDPRTPCSRCWSASRSATSRAR
jgi:hypothetical protein